MDYPDPENSLQLLLKNNHPPGPNSSYFHNEKFEQSFYKFKKEKDSKTRLTLINEMQDIVKKELPWVMLYYDRRFILIRNHVHNYRPADIIQNKYKYLKISTPTK